MIIIDKEKYWNYSDCFNQICFSSIYLFIDILFCLDINSVKNGDILKYILYNYMRAKVSSALFFWKLQTECSVECCFFFLCFRYLKILWTLLVCMYGVILYIYIYIYIYIYVCIYIHTSYMCISMHVRIL